MIGQKELQQHHTISGTRIIVSTICGINSIAGVMRGSFEILQGSSPPNGLVIYDLHAAEKLTE